MARKHLAPRPAAPPPEPTHWYGWQTLTADGAAIALLVGGFAAIDTDYDDLSGPLGALTMGTYALGSPIIHVLHHQVGRGGISLGMRLVLPFTGMLVGAVASSGCDGLLCQFDAMGWGIGLGAFSAIVLDAAVLAHEPLNQHGSGATLRFVPALGFAGRRAWLGVRGSL